MGPKAKKARFARDESRSRSGPSSRTRSKTELGAVPAKRFPRFRDLPIELRQMIWDFAMPGTFIEAKYYFAKGHFQSSSSTLPASASSVLTPKVFPLYLTLNPALSILSRIQSILSSIIQRLDGVAVAENTSPAIEPLYMQSRDIIYLPDIAALDVDALLARKENHVIEHLALPPIEVPLSGSSQWFKTTEVGKLLRGLKNLKNVYIVDGSKFLSEATFRTYEGEKYRFSWSRVKEGPERIIARCLSTAVEDMARNGEKWDPPRFIFRELRRTLVKK